MLQPVVNTLAGGGAGDMSVAEGAQAGGGLLYGPPAGVLKRATGTPLILGSETPGQQAMNP